jgi:uncharacterized protein (TIGR02145 family)
MKKIFFAFFLISVLFSCTKETNTPKTDDNTASNDVSISSFDCSGVVTNGKLQLNKLTNNVYVEITYTGGNGKSYLTKSHTSTGVTGLSATLLAGTLANGEGVLTYNITGTPSSAGLASFKIFLGGKSCSFSINVNDLSENPTSGYGANIKDIDGNIYKTVYIGTQQWMAENLKTTKYDDGVEIPNVSDSIKWLTNNNSAWCYFNNNENNNDKYGKIYNGKVINNNKNVCPTGWHVPLDSEWKVLVDYLGGETVAGGKMKDVNSIYWKNPNIHATNLSLFTGLPGGVRYDTGKFTGEGNFGSWWSSGLNTFVLQNQNGGINITRGSFSAMLLYGSNIRCIKN